MCRGGRLVADFMADADADARPAVPEELDEHLTVTADGQWVVWAYKLARPEGELFVPLTGGPGYPADAQAACRLRGERNGHRAPDPECTCGFHALSDRSLPRLPAADPDLARLTVALSGRVLAFEWSGPGILWRAERQTVVRVDQLDWPDPAARWSRPARAERLPRERRRPDDPEGRLAAVAGATPRDSGPVRLRLPASAPVLPVSHDDAGWCLAAGGTSPLERSPAALVLA
jgi:hypothetical protein